MKYSRLTSFIICIFVYLIAFTIAYAFIFFYQGALNQLWRAFVADVIATVVVFVFSVLFKNSSLYDPYWSVAPPLIAWYWIKPDNLNTEQCLMLIAISFWAIRLTFNWARGWQGLVHEDWRYIMLHDKNPKLYWLTNFAGIHLFPTIMVFIAMLPVFCIAKPMWTPTVYPLLAYIGFGICLIATVVELIADEQMRSFKKRAKPGEFIDEGLWKFSRHPNYFGEISFWFGLWVMQMSDNGAGWWMGVGFVATLLMFVFASIPMMEEKNLKSKAGYEEYVRKVSVLVPWFRK